MRRVCWLFPVLLLGLGPAVLADPVRPSKDGSAPPFMRVFGNAYPPYGFVQFCQREASECVPGSLADHRFAATPARLSELDEVNRAVNQAIAPATDLELYGTQEYWTLPTDKGDCEDYALLKRHILMQKGWPASALLLTVVRDERGEGHAVLTARTVQGDFVLDNKTPEVRVWHRLGYQFIMRQSYLDPKVWVSLDPNEMLGTVPLTGMPKQR